MKYDITIAVLLATVCFGIQPTEANARLGNFSDASIKSVAAYPDNLRVGIFSGDAVQSGDDVLDSTGQILKAVKFEMRHAPEVQFMDDSHDQIMGSTAFSDDWRSITLQHRSLAYFSQPDARSILALVFMFFLIQSRALIPGRGRVSDAKVRGGRESLRPQRSLAV